MKIIADDGTQFDTVDACLAHEATLPYLKLFAEVEAAVAQDAAFAAKIEALGFRLRRERYDRGEKRTRTPKDASARHITGPVASADIRAEEGREGDEARTDEAA